MIIPDIIYRNILTTNEMPPSTGLKHRNPKIMFVFNQMGFAEQRGVGLRYMKQTQLLETLYYHDGSVIFAKTEAFLREGEFYGTKVVPYFMPPERAVDIDSLLDLAWAEFLLSRSSLK